MDKVTSHSDQSLSGIWFLLGTAVAAVILFYRLGDLPIQVWDEARLANNALEMSQAGLSLVTTYDGTPDHWNTKPPLLVWAMTVSIWAFGPTEWAIRLPSAVAALITVMVVFGFCAKQTRRPWTAFAAVLVMLASPSFVQGTDFWTNPGELLQNHAARSGNYEATLTLFTTIYLIAAYEFLSGRSAPGRGWLLVSFGAIVLAFLTKTIQALLFLPALLIFAAAKGRLVTTFRSRAFWLLSLGSLFICVGYYLAREQVDPGYIRGALAYDFGRFRAVSDGHDGAWHYYLSQFRLFPAMVPFLFIGAVQGLTDRGERRVLSAYIALATAVYLAILSLSATKLWWYAVPVVPLTAIAVALSLDMVSERLAGSESLRRAFQASAVAWLLALGAGSLVVFRNLQLDEMGAATAWSRHQDAHSYFLRGPVAAAPELGKIVVLHPGYSRAVYYVAPTLFYANALRIQGRVVSIQSPDQPLPPDFDTVVVCGGTAGPAIAGAQRLVAVLEDEGCAALRPE